MSDDLESKQPAAIYEPGELDKTRKNIGALDEEEARKMTKVLGGQIFTEKSAPIDYSTLPSHSHHYNHRASGSFASDIASIESETPKDGSGGQKKETAAANKPHTPNKNNQDTLPQLSSRVRQMIDRLMMGDDYKIKPNYGLFNFIRYIKKNGTEKINKEFAEYTVKNHVDHMQIFITSIKTLIQISPDTYKGKIASDEEARFRFLRTVGGWTMRDIKVLALDVEENSDDMTVSQLVPFVRAVYKQLLTVYFMGETQIPMMIKEVYSDLILYPKSDKEKLASISKEAITEWLYLYTQVIKGMYPLLMRMCSVSFEDFPGFFNIQIAAILQFIGLTKYQIQMPDKKNGAKKEEKKEAEKKEEAAPAPKQDINMPGAKTEIVNAGFALLDQLFPDAGFTQLDTMPDMFPYFQPLYQFPDGFNMLAPQNPIQITVVLIRIIEDLFQGCRNIKFNIEVDSSISAQKDTLASAMNDWSLYREVLFDRQYGDQLRNFVNQQYTQSDFKSSQFGKKMITSMLWQTKYNFLPHFEFEQLLLEKPQNDSQYRPLCLRTEFLRVVFTILSHRIDESAKSKSTVTGIQNPWEKYKFDIPNVVSKRMDVLLGAKRPVQETAATNANLVKYTLCVMSVLDWWVNNIESPAYGTDSSKIYRISDKDGAPQFSVPLREDQNKLFAQRIKETVSKLAK
jgi:hypothetical protein